MDEYKFRWSKAIVTWILGMGVVFVVIMLPMSTGDDLGVTVMFVIGTGICTAFVFLQAVSGVFDEKVVKK